jgi:hypothetical protein
MRLTRRAWLWGLCETLTACGGGGTTAATPDAADLSALGDAARVVEAATEGTAEATLEVEIEYPFDSPPQQPLLKTTTAAPTLMAGGEAMVFVNGRLSDASSSYAVNRIVEHHILGSAMFVYDPLQPGKLMQLGWPDLGDLAATTWTGPSPKERQKLGVYDLAWSPSQGLWGFSLDSVNDEWLLTHWDLSDFARPDQHWGADFWAVPEEADHDHTLYWEDDISAMCFLDEVLWVGTSGDPKTTGTQGGQLYELDIALPPSYSDLPPPNRNWYLAEAVPGPVLTLDDGIAFAGAMVCEGKTIRAIAHYYHAAAGPPDVDFLVSIDLEKLTVTRAPTDIAITGDRNDIEGLARIGGALYGLTVDGRVHLIDEATGAATPHDDLAPLFTDLANDVRIRGATRVEVP